MLQIAILGLGSFGVRMLEELSAVGCEIIVVDRDAEKIEKYKTHARAVYITDVINKDSFMKIIPSNIDAAIVDFDHLLEPAILTTHYLHQMGIKNIVVQCENDTHGELLTLAGASQIVYPEYEAAKRITPLLISKQLNSYIQLSTDFAIAEVEILEEIEGKALKDCGLRNNYGINVIACRNKDDTEFTTISGPDFVFSKDCNILIAGNKISIEKYIKKDIKKERFGTKLLLDRFIRKSK